MTGALVTAADYRGLGAVQSLGRRGVDIHRVDCPFPAILKPAVKAWRVDDKAALHARYTDALRLLPADELLVQELIPSNGGAQLPVT